MKKPSERLCSEGGITAGFGLAEIAFHISFEIVLPEWYAAERDIGDIEPRDSPLAAIQTARPDSGKPPFGNLGGLTH